VPGLPEDLPAPKKLPRGGQGQWGAGHLEPLNPNERTKKDDDGLNVRARIENIYSVKGFASIDAADLRGRMRWWGLYTQRKPGIDGGLTATLEPEELDDEYFMLRVRIPGGQLNLEQLRVCARIAQEFGRDLADVSDRQNFQYHWIRIEDVPEIWRRLEAVGLSTTEACGDTPRNILGCPLAGVDAEEVIDATAALRSIEDRYVGDKAFSNLPRKFKTTVTGCPNHCTAHEIHDVAFVGVRHPETGEAGFDVWVGGGLSINPMIGQRLGVFVPQERVAEVWEGVISIFRDWGYRRSRTRARIKFLVADWGPERFRAVLERLYLSSPLEDGPAPEPARDGRRDHVGVHPQKGTGPDGGALFSVGAALPSGRTSGTALLEVASLAEKWAGANGGRIRLTAEQKVVMLDVAESAVETVCAELTALGMNPRPSSFRRHTMACTGIQFCKLALTETKSTADVLVEELEKRLPGFDEPVRMHVNGCPNSCARFQIADIGFKGMQVTTADGRRVDGFQVHLGGELGTGAALGRKVRGLKVAAEDLPDYVEGLLRRWESVKTEGETFAEWARGADEALLTEGASVLASSSDDS
jgi:sulfite reductase (ferredoxin)